MTFDVPAELSLFGESLRAALAGWQPPREPDLGSWQDDRDDVLAGRLADAGWSELWAGPELLGPAVAGGIELGRAAAPVSVLDEATLGAPLWIDGRARHGRAAASLLCRSTAAVSPSARRHGRGPPGADARRERHGHGRRRGIGRASSRSPPPRAGARGTPRRSPTSRDSRRAPSSSRSRTRVPVSSSGRRSRRFPPCSRVSPTRRSRRTRSTLLAWAGTVERRWRPGRGAALGGNGLLRGHRERAADVRRARVRARVGPPRLLPPSPLRAGLGGRCVRRAALSR